MGILQFPRLHLTLTCLLLALCFSLTVQPPMQAISQEVAQNGNANAQFDEPAAKPTQQGLQAKTAGIDGQERKTAAHGTKIKPGLTEQKSTHGQVAFLPLHNETELPKRYQQKAHKFEFVKTPHRSVKRAVDISLVQFPSPVVTPHAANNQVHCEFFQPIGDDGNPINSTPGVIVLHILGGDFELARAFCMAVVRRGSSALFLKMPYYGPRRTKGVDRRMVSENPRHTVEGMTQAILDIRRATAWLGAQKTVDEHKLGVFGISLGGITGALATGVEPRLHNTCLMLAGGDVGRIIWESNETRKARDAWLAMGRTREEFEQIVADVDPVHLAHRARGRRILMLNAKDDKVVPRQATVALWKAFDEPPIVWYDGGHYSAVRHIFDAFKRVGDFYETAEAAPQAK